MQYMLIHLFSAFVMGWVAAWCGIAFVHQTSYHSIFGGFKFWFISRWMNEQELGYYQSIINNEALSTDMQSQHINEIVYDSIAKRKMIVKLLTCQYCVAMQFIIWSALSYCFYFGLTWACVPVLFTGTASVYFNLNFSK